MQHIKIPAKNEFEMDSEIHQGRCSVDHHLNAVWKLIRFEPLG